MLPTTWVVHPLQLDPVVNMKKYILLSILFLISTSPVVALNPTQLSIIYEPPTFGTSTTLLTGPEVVSRFQNVIYARNQMKGELPKYISAGFKGKAYVYLIADNFGGPVDLGSVAAQKTRCTSAQKSFKIYSNNSAMDTGDFCEVHDAIISKTALPDYPDIFPTENWFLHRADGSRINKGHTPMEDYVPNPSDPNWQKYYSRRALREMIGGNEIDSSSVVTPHPAVAGVTGLFIDNIELGWSNVTRANGGLAPVEYSSIASYNAAVASFLSTVKNTLQTAPYNYPVWANMISDPNTGTSWDQFKPYLNGGMNESFGLSWGKGPTSSSNMLQQLTQAESWINSGRHFLAVVQGDANKSYMGYSLGSFLLVTNGTNASYYYANYSGNYHELYEIPELYYQLGLPTESRRQISTAPIIFERKFQNGKVTVNLSAFTASIILNSGATSPTPTPTIVVSDKTPPIVFITSPKSGATVSRNHHVTINATATDNVGITKLEYYINNTLKCTYSSVKSCNWSVPRQSNVSYTILVKAYDAAGNIGSSSIPVKSSR